MEQELGVCFAVRSFDSELLLKMLSVEILALKHFFVGLLMRSSAD